MEGFSIHAGVHVRADDRRSLERLCRYIARPPVATDRLQILPDGRLSYRLKTPWRDGTTHVIFEALEFLEKLAALVPAPRANLIRYHGVLAPAANWRSQVVPVVEAASPEPSTCDCDKESDKPRRLNYSWAALMARVFEIDVLEWPECKGRIRTVAAIQPREAARKILNCLGLAPRSPPEPRSRRATRI